MIRMLSRSCRPVVAFVVCSLVPAGVYAQSAPGTSPTVPSAVPQVVDTIHGLDPAGLQTVHVFDQAGVETSGKLLAFGAESVRLLVDGVERPFELKDVARIDRRDSLRNGAIIGACVGLVMGLVTAGISDCPGDDPGGSCAGFRAFTLVMVPAVYTTFGIGVDALVPGRTTLYRSPASTRVTRSTSPGPAATLRAGISW